MWTVVYISQSSELAYELTELLEENGILTKLKTVSGDGEVKTYEILVPETEIEEAHNLILDRE